MSMPPTLSTSRLRLREWNAGDLDAIVAIKTDPENWRFIGNGGPKTLEDAARVLGVFQGEWLTHGIGRWAVEEEVTGELVGDCGIVLSERGPQLAYMIKRSKWGLRFATEAAFAVLVHAFTTFEWPSVFASTHPKNTASRRVLEKLGMRQTQTIATPHGEECWYELERAIFLR
jgi:RimJ/RimL family protein N-acetyltransferase